VSPSVTVLSLSDSPDFRRAEALLALTERLLDLLATHVLDNSALEAHVFRAQLDARRQDLRAEHDAHRLSSLTHTIADECGAFLDRTRADRDDREVELIDLVNVLREVVDTVRGDSLQFTHELSRSTTAMDRMVELEDIRELKRALAREVHALREAVARDIARHRQGRGRD
jgi:hypothetical protein